VEIMGSQNCRTAGESQSVLMMIDPIIFTRTPYSSPPPPPLPPPGANVDDDDG
jgi:hypothetical protein